MFLSLAQLFQIQDPNQPAAPARESVFLVHPLQLSRWLDEAWTAAALVPPIPGQNPAVPFLGDPGIVDVLDLPRPVVGAPPPLPSGVGIAAPADWTGAPGPVGVGLLWHHLVYAYLVESTGLVEIFAEVVRRLVIGESLGSLSQGGARWLRATEELFFRDPPLFAIHGLLSEARPHARISRRNAYWRMFGLDLPHPVPARWGAGDERLWKEDVGQGVNADFRPKWTELLRQVWLGVENRSNSSGTNAADPNYVAMLCQALRDMMNNRRRGGLLAREEFAYVTMLSWFHLTLQSDSPIVLDLQARASSPADRLGAIAQRVGMSPAQRSRELFELAEPVSTLLRSIELGLFDSALQASTLFDGTVPQLTQDATSIVNLWQSATGERVKERSLPTAAAVSAQPLRIPTPLSGAIGAAGNGRPAGAPRG